MIHTTRLTAQTAHSMTDLRVLQNTWKITMDNNENFRHNVDIHGSLYHQAVAQDVLHLYQVVGQSLVPTAHSSQPQHRSGVWMRVLPYVVFYQDFMVIVWSNIQHHIHPAEHHQLQTVRGDAEENTKSGICYVLCSLPGTDHIILSSSTLLSFPCLLPCHRRMFDTVVSSSHCPKTSMFRSVGGRCKDQNKVLLVWSEILKQRHYYSKLSW